MSCSDVGESMIQYVEKIKLLTQLRSSLIFCLHLTKRTIITQAIDFYLNLGLESTHVQRFVWYTPMRCINSFVPSALNAWGLGDETALSDFVTETMKLSTNSFYGYHFLWIGADTQSPNI